MEIGVVSHIKRLGHAHHLADTVDADFVSVDDGTQGCERNHRNVWRWHHERESDWAVILEDDAIPVPDFRNQLTQALTVAPTPLVSLYLGRQRPPWAQDAIADAINRCNGDWILGRHMLHAVGYAIRTDHLTQLITYPETNTPIDQHISAWANNALQSPSVAYAYPSLVDHADLPTIVCHPDGEPRPPGRTAWNTAPHPNWSPRSVEMKV